MKLYNVHSIVFAFSHSTGTYIMPPVLLGSFLADAWWDYDIVNYIFHKSGPLSGFFNYFTQMFNVFLLRSSSAHYQAFCKT